jgi:hypothetical protein
VIENSNAEVLSNPNLIDVFLNFWNTRRNEFVAYLCDELKDLIEGPAAEAATAAAGRSAGNPNARRTAM